MSINKVVITGNLTREPELRMTQSGIAVMSFSLAVNDKQKINGEWKDVPVFIECTIFGTRAESLMKYLSKGSKVAVDGKLRYSSWEKDGQKRSKLDVIVGNLELLTHKKKADDPITLSPDAEVTVYDDDIPF